MEKPASLERNIERDKINFVEAINSFLIEEIETDFDELSEEEIKDSLNLTNIFVLGEMHGVKENPNIIYTLFKRFGFRQLALEWDPKMKGVINKYLNSGEIDFDLVKNSSDGRITAGHFALVKKLIQEKLLDSLVCFDKDWGSGPNDRDANMAKDILNNLSKSTLVVAGNLHTKFTTFSLKENGREIEFHPMGSIVKEKIGDSVWSGRIKYLKGEYHNFGLNKFYENEEIVAVPGMARFYIGEDGVIVYELPEAHVATVPNPNERLEE